MADSDSLPPLEAAPAQSALPVERLYRHCEPGELAFETTAELEPLARQPGQERAVEALGFGLAIEHEGYNLYLMGSSGVGKRELLQGILREAAARGDGAISDWCYVNNFEAPDHPLVLRLPRGMGCELRRDMARAVEDLLASLPATFQSEEYHSRVQELGEEFQEQSEFQQIAERAAQHDIAMIQTPSGYTLAPTKNGEVIPPNEFEALPEEEKKATLALIEELKGELKGVVRQLPRRRRESMERFRQLNREFSQLAIDPVFADLKQKYEQHADVVAYLEAAHHDVLEEAEAFTQEREESAIPENLKERAREFTRYGVNVLVDNADLETVPIVYEDNPTFANLLGRSEHFARMGTLLTDFSLIKPGALHRANGGYLLLDADKLLTQPFAWTGLKRALKARDIRIQSPEQFFSFAATAQLEPEPVPLDVKVLMLGDRYLFHLLQEYDPEFVSLFRVTADMTEDVDRTPENTGLFARMLHSLSQEYGLLALDRSAVARVIEHAARRVEDSTRLSVHRGRLQSLLTESDFLARRAGASSIAAGHVDAAIEAAVHRLDQLRERSQEGILREIMLVATEGTAVGQVNGLAVYLLGDYAFGRPTRITATARLGAGKVLDIEREVDLGGKIHSKAVMIISALLADRYARNRPLPLSASLVFEQSYGGIEGDSASVAELVALVSAIADIPVRQELAVTGSLNQHGTVQAIGGVNEKVEGFFDICNARGLSGSQGVVIPAANAVHLMLRRDVRDAVAEGRFHVYTADDIDRALELLTGFSVASIDARVSARVDELQALSRRFSGRGESAGRGDDGDG